MQQPDTGRAYSKAAKRARKRLSAAKRTGALRLPAVLGRVAQAEQELERREAERAARVESMHVLNRLARKDRRAVNERQRQAGMTYFGLWQASQSTVTSQLDPGRAPGSNGTSFPLERLEACVEAGRQLRAARVALGSPLRAVLDPIVLECRSPEELAAERSAAAGRQVTSKVVLELLRVGLDALAEHFEGRGRVHG